MLKLERIEKFKRKVLLIKKFCFNFALRETKFNY